MDLENVLSRPSPLQPNTVKTEADGSVVVKGSQELVVLPPNHEFACT